MDGSGLDRRLALKLMGAAAAATVSTGALPQEQGAGAIDRDWDAVRALFDLVPDRIHMSTMLIALARC